MLELARRYEAEGRTAEFPSGNVVAVVEAMQKLRLPRIQEIVRSITVDNRLEVAKSVLHLVHPLCVFDDHQVDIVGSILCGLTRQVTELGAKGCTKAGKGAAVAAAANIWFDVSPQAKVVITSQSHAHARDVMFAEVVSWRKRQKVGGDGDIYTTRISVDEQKYMTVANPETGEGFSGHHGPATLFIFDESSGAREDYYDLAKTQAALIVAIANPRTMSGWFRRMFPAYAPDENQTLNIPGGSRRLITVSGLDCRNVKESREVIPNQIDRVRFDAIMAHPDSRWSRVFGLGQFPEEDPQLQLILPSWLERHRMAWRPDIQVEAFGLDVAASESGDRTVLVAGGSQGVALVHQLREVDTMRGVGWVLRTAESHHNVRLTGGGCPICVDMDGLGKGVGDRLAEQGCWVVEHRGNAVAQDPKRFANARTENYAMLADRLNPSGPWPELPWGIPSHEYELAEDLCAPEKVYGSDGFRFGLTPKDRTGTSREVKRGRTIRDKLGRSPDVGDAVVYMYTAWRKIGVNRYRRGGEIIASGEDPVEERRPLTEDEMGELPDFLRELVSESRISGREKMESRRWGDDNF